MTSYTNPGTTTMQGSTRSQPRTGFWKALGKLILFQVKLACDALRDFVMSPLSIIAFLLDALFRPEPDNSWHQKLMSFGRRTDRWINLFEEFGSDAGQPEARPAMAEQDEAPKDQDPAKTHRL